MHPATLGDSYISIVFLIVREKKQNNRHSDIMSERERLNEKI
jgi:hypothetical protein